MADLDNAVLGRHPQVARHALRSKRLHVDDGEEKRVGRSGALVEPDLEVVEAHEGTVWQMAEQQVGGAFLLVGRLEERPAVTRGIERLEADARPGERSPLRRLRWRPVQAQGKRGLE